jgi:glycosyltransferase involved in cell wall biosynthesis
LAHGLAETQDEVRVFAFDPNPMAPTCAGALSVARVECPITTGSPATIVGHQRALVERVASSSWLPGPLLIHAHDWFVAGAALELRRCLHAPLIAFFHSDKRAEYSDRLDVDRKIIHRLQYQLAHEADLVFCYSRFMRACLAKSLKLDPARIADFRCGMDEDARPRDATALSGPPRLLYLGRLASEKDVATLLRAFRLVHMSLPQCHLRVVGDGPQRAALVDLARATSLAGHIEFLPFTSCPEAVDRELRHAHALVLPSVFEPFGLVVLEAVSRGVPVIVPSVGGPSEIVEHDVTGFTFTPGNVAELASRILSCLSDPARAAILAEAAHRHATAHFRWSKAVRTISERCRDLTLQRPAIERPS